MTRIWFRGFALLLSATGAMPLAFAHQDHAHHEEQTSPKTPHVADELDSRLILINEAYKKDVKSIFQKSCFNCHSQSPKLPWYHSVPLVHGLLESDMKEAKVHLDFSNDFPFKGHGSPKEDLRAISKSIEGKSMPPFRYKLMHWNSGLSDDEEKTVLKWAAEGLKLLD